MFPFHLNITWPLMQHYPLLLSIQFLAAPHRNANGHIGDFINYLDYHKLFFLSN